MGLYIFKFGASYLEKFHIKYNSPAVLVTFSLSAILNLNCITADNDKVGSRTNPGPGSACSAVYACMVGALVRPMLCRLMVNVMNHGMSSMY